MIRSKVTSVEVLSPLLLCLLKQIGVVFSHLQCCSVLGSQSLFIDRQGAPVERLGLLVLPLVSIEATKALNSMLYLHY
jgi:hypothetical protein